MTANKDDSRAGAASAPPARKVSNATVAILILLFLAVGVGVAGVRNVSGGEVGVRVNNLARTIELANRVGLHFTIPYLTSFYTIDRKTRQLDMLSNAAIPAESAERPPDDSLNVKSKEGDSVKIDVKIQYQIIPEKAVEVLQSTGSEMLELMKSETTKAGVEKWRRFEQKWIWPVVRATLADRFNEITREEMNDGPKRTAQAELARADSNQLLSDRYGVEIKLITVENPSSYPNYEVVVRARKDIEQEVAAIVEEQKQESEAQKRQVTVEEENKKKELSAAKANFDRFLAEAGARKHKTIGEELAEAHRETSGADATLAIDIATADGIRKKGEAEAEGLRQLAIGLSGPQGLSVVANEIAKRMAQITIQASPFVYNGVVQPYLMQQGSNLVPSPNVKLDAGAPPPAQGPIVK